VFKFITDIFIKTSDHACVFYCMHSVMRLRFFYLALYWCLNEIGLLPSWEFPLCLSVFVRKRAAGYTHLKNIFILDNWGKTTDTHSQYVIFIAFPWQRWLHERTWNLHYMYVVCLVKCQVLVHKTLVSTNQPQQHISSK